MNEPQILEIKSQEDCSLSDDSIKIDWIFLNEFADITLQSLAESLGLSKRQTQRLLLARYGMTFQQKKDEARLEHAKLLLADEALTIQAIADTCGFYGSAAFSGFFKKAAGISPTDYRKNF